MNDLVYHKKKFSRYTKLQKYMVKRDCKNEKKAIKVISK